MKFLIITAFCVTACLAGCAGSKDAVASHDGDFTGQKSCATGSHSSIVASDTTHKGSTWSEERESARKQMRLVAVIVVVAMFLILAVTLGRR